MRYFKFRRMIYTKLDSHFKSKEELENYCFKMYKKYNSTHRLFGVFVSVNIYRDILGYPNYLQSDNIYAYLVVIQGYVEAVLGERLEDFHTDLCEISRLLGINEDYYFVARKEGLIWQQ